MIPITSQKSAASMKFQPKRFVVEVKRGTNRATFASPDPSVEKFGNAEALLFSRSVRIESEQKQPEMAEAGRPGGRILRSLVEPPPPAVPDIPEPVRRGRKPGSKNKPKPQALSPVVETDIVAERPRRGRKPGSKNKPKILPPAAVAAPGFPGSATDTAALMRSYGFGDDATAWSAPAADAEPRATEAVPSPAPAPRDAGEAGPARSRLRDRSVILRRYVLDLEPGPGQRGSLRARRLARAVR